MIVVVTSPTHTQSAPSPTFRITHHLACSQQQPLCRAIASVFHWCFTLVKLIIRTLLHPPSRKMVPALERTLPKQELSMRGKRLFIGLRALAIFAVTLLVTSSWAAIHWNEKVLHSFNGADGQLSRCRPGLRCCRQSLWHDALAALTDAGRCSSCRPPRVVAGRRRCCIASTDGTDGDIPGPA